jgi:hypothetical protein
MNNIKGKLIPGNKVKNLPLGTKVLVHIPDPEQDCWTICVLKKNENDDYLYLFDIVINANVTDLDDLDDFCTVYEYNEEDAKRLVGDIPEKQPEEQSPKKPRYVFDKDWMAIFDTEKNHIVCLVDTRRPDLLESKLKELLDLANRS